MKQTSIILIIANLACLPYLISGGIIEFFPPLILPIIVALLGFATFLLFWKNKIFFIFVLIISIIWPSTILYVYANEGIRYLERIKEKEERTVEWRNKNCLQSTTEPDKRGYVKYECGDKSMRYYLNDVLRMSERPIR